MTHRARKRFGQNFLTDPTVIADIIGSLQISPGEHWVEIGPGRGALTAPLLQNPINLDVVELDRDLVALLQRRFQHADNLAIHSADALNFDFTSLPEHDEPLRVVGNLPYNISTPLLFHLMDNAACIEDMHFMLQKEVVERMCALPGSKKYGRLTVMLQYHCTAEYLFEVAPESFDPPPKVTSAIIRLIPHRKPPVQVDSVPALNRVVTEAFSQRRKTIRNALKKLMTEDRIASLGLDPSVRAELLSLEDFAHLSNCLSGSDA